STSLRVLGEGAWATISRVLVSLMRSSLGAVSQIHQFRIDAKGRAVVGNHPFGAKAHQIGRAAGLEAGAGEAFTAARLAAGHGAHLVAVDVGVAEADARHRVIDVRLDAALYGQGGAVAAALDAVDDFVRLVVSPGGDVQRRPQNAFCRK